MHSTEVKKKSYRFSICLFIQGVVRTGLGVERELVAHSTEGKSGLSGRQGRGSISYGGIFNCALSIFFLWDSQKSQRDLLTSNLLWSVLIQRLAAHTSAGDSSWQLCDKGESLKGQGCPRAANVVLLSRRWSVSFQQMFPPRKDRKCHRESRSNWVKSHVRATWVKRTRLGKRNQPLDGAMTADCWWLRFKLPRIKLSEGAFLTASVF